MNIVVYGHDYPAMVTASSLAANGNNVTLVPIDAPTDWQWHEIAHRHNGLLVLMSEQLSAKTLIWGQTSDVGLYANANVHIMSLMSAQVGSCDALVQNLAAIIERPALIVLQTLHGVGKAKAYQSVLKNAMSPAAVVVWPSFMSEGVAVGQFQRPERIIVGAEPSWAVQMMRELVRPFNRVQDMLLVVSPTAAELTKYAINTLLALRVSAMNEFANLAETLDVDIEQVRQGIGTDPRIGFNYLYPGAGFGGANFMADLHTTMDTFTLHGVQPRLLSAAMAVNERQQEVLFSKLWQYYQGDLVGKTFALWGVAYKPNATSIDSASSLPLIDALLSQGASLRIHDPKAMPELAKRYPNHPNIVLCQDPYLACDASHALLVMTEWKQYWSPDFERMKTSLLEAIIFDGRNIYDPETLAARGFRYLGVGRKG